MLVSINVFSPDGSRDKLYLTNYAISQMNDRLARIPGVGDLEVLGPREYSMRIWINPDKLSKFNMTPAVLVKALREQNKQVAAGALNQSPDANPDLAYELTINTKGRFTKPSEFENIIIKYTDDGKVVKLKDVARVELGLQGDDKHVVIADVVGDGRHQRGVVAEALEVVLDLLIQTYALAEVADEVGGGGGAAAVTADKDTSAGLPGLLHQIHKGADRVQIQLGQNLLLRFQIGPELWNIIHTDFPS